ncbi:Hypothetical protein FKW44_014374 [Caligus rogercresseyi]|uniref:Uncharacterized protein n=1 Tax=Caligus rogercresseyi TaxID=217165 RepID=A0A7T8JZV7_CALRO|nr:Hypothetical protein FKW44_014374 [Caligus rogercresseyi]
MGTSHSQDRADLDGGKMKFWPKGFLVTTESGSQPTGLKCLMASGSKTCRVCQGSDGLSQQCLIAFRRRVEAVIMAMAIS